MKDNPFKQCKNSDVPEAVVAFDYWCLSVKMAIDDNPALNPVLIGVYFDWLDEYADYDLNNKWSQI